MEQSCQDSNLRPLGCKSNNLTTTPPHHMQWLQAWLILLPWRKEVIKSTIKKDITFLLIFPPLLNKWYITESNVFTIWIQRIVSEIHSNNYERLHILNRKVNLWMFEDHVDMSAQVSSYLTAQQHTKGHIALEWLVSNHKNLTSMLISHNTAEW